MSRDHHKADGLIPYTGLYRDQHLGLYSSHPFWLERGSRRLRQVLVGVIISAYLLVLYLWLRGHGIDQMLPAFGSWIISQAGGTVVGMAMFGLGMMAAATFQLRVALRRQSPDIARMADKPVAWSPGIALVVGLTGFVLPLVLTFAPGLPFEARFFGALIAMTPVATLSYLLPAHNAKPARFPFFTAVLIMPALVVGAFSMAGARWVALQLPQGVLNFFPILQTLHGISQAALALCALCMVVLAFQLVAWFQGLSAAKGRAQIERIVPQESPWRRFLRFVGLGFLFKEKKKSQEEADDAECLKDSLDWVRDLVKQCGLVVSEPNPKEESPLPDEVSDLCEDSSFDLLFGGHRPTFDQHKVVSDYNELQSRCLADIKGEIAGSGFEMILEGPAGCGRSTTLDALALNSVLGSGRACLMLVADEGRVKFVCQRLRRKLTNLHLNPFVVAGGIQEAWNAIDSKTSPPDICVATPAQWEELVPGQFAREGDAYEHARNLMKHYSTVLVDDWLDHSVEVRAHLPFIIDKHRLFLESEMIPRACVFAFPRLTETGRNLAINRLIGHRGIIDETRQVARLRYRPLPATTVLDVICESVDEAITKLADAIACKGLPSILLRKGIDFSEATRQTEEFRTRFRESKMTVCYCNDQMESAEGELSAVLMKSATEPDAIFALRAHRDDVSLVVIRVKGSHEIEPVTRITPLIVDRTGRGMVEAHLRNILRFIDPLSPVHRRCWGQLGLDIPDSATSCGARPVGRLRLDLPELISESIRRSRPYLSKLGSYIVLGQKFTVMENVDCHGIPDPGSAPWFRSGNTLTGPDELFLPESTESVTGRRNTVLWMGNEGAELGQSQLHYMESLLLKRHQIFCPDAIREDTGSGLEIQAARFSDNGLDAIHPKTEINWKSEFPKIDDPESLIVTGYGGPDHRFIWANSTASSGWKISSKLVERVDEMDRPSPCFGFEFSWQASLRPLFLCPTAAVIDKQEDYKKTLSEFFQDQTTPWGTRHDDFLPGLTYALTRGVEVDLPSSGFFGKMLAFRLTGPMAEYAKAVVWFIEPLGTGATLSTAVHDLLKEKDYFGDLATRMDRILRQGWEKSPPIELAKFWLPRRLRKPVSLFEKKLVKILRDGSHNTLQIDTIPMRVELKCPHCQESFETPFAWGGGPQTVKHCEKLVQLLFTGTEYRVLTPADLQISRESEIYRPTYISCASNHSAAASVAWKSISDRVPYELDHVIDKTVPFDGDLFLTPEQTWSRREGDCDDHATLFTEIMRTADIRAYTYLGWVWRPDGYHAWSSVFDGDIEYLIEATGQPEDPLTVFHDGIENNGFKYEIDKNCPRFSSEGIEVWNNDQWEVVPMAKLLDSHKTKA
jgi:Transglutaminase-like superfamily